jgi:hypothetical protein
MSAAKRKVGAASRNHQGRVHALIDQGFLRELRMRAPGVPLVELARKSGVKFKRLGELERGRGKRVTSSESVAIVAVLYRSSGEGVWGEGVCRVCGCTDEWSCDAGCLWVNAEHTLCSECVDGR